MIPSFKQFLDEQRYTSKYTALNQVAQTFKAFDFSGFAVLDYGCGRGFSKNFCLAKGYEIYLYDPFWGFDEREDFLKSPNPGIITCNNVLNVLEDVSEILGEIKDIAKKKPDFRKVIFKIYEGDGSGTGKVTRTVKGETSYQRNQPTRDYIPEIKKILKGYTISTKGKFIICS